MRGDSKNPNFREFSTPPPPPHPSKSWTTAPRSPLHKSPHTPKSDSFHAVHKVPSGDSPYVQAKHVQLIDKDPNKAISLFWTAINAGDRVDSAVKDMALVMKQLDRTDEAIEAIRSFRHLCTPKSQESLDNVLIDLYKRGGRMQEHIQLLEQKVRLIEEGIAFGGRMTKLARSQGKKLHISVEQEKSRLLGNLAWAYMQESNYGIAEEIYRKALSIEPDKNKQCNLAICLMHRRKIVEAKAMLKAVTPSSEEREMEDPFIKSFDRAYQMLIDIEKNPALNLHNHTETQAYTCRSLTSPINNKSKSVKKLSFSQPFEDKIDPSCYHKGRFTGERRMEEGVDTQSSQFSNSEENQKKEPCSRRIFEKGTGSSGLDSIELKPISEECGASKNVKSYGAPVSFYRCSNIQRRESTYYSQYTANGEASKPWHYGANMKQAMFTPTKSPISPAYGDWRKRLQDNEAGKKQKRTIELKSAKSPQYPGTVIASGFSGDTQACTGKNLDQRSEVTILGSVSENITAKGTLEEHGAKDLITGNSPIMQQCFTPLKKGKSWADMVEEEEEELLRECTNATMSTFKYHYQESPVTFQTPCKSLDTWSNEELSHSENTDPNTTGSTPRCPTSLRAETQRDYYTQDIQRKNKFVDLEGKQSKNIDSNSCRNSTTPSALSYEKTESAKTFCPSPLLKKALFHSEDDTSTVPMGRRLHVFQEITLHDKPRV